MFASSWSAATQRNEVAAFALAPAVPICRRHPNLMVNFEPKAVIPLRSIPALHDACAHPQSVCLVDRNDPLAIACFAPPPTGNARTQPLGATASGYAGELLDTRRQRNGEQGTSGRAIPLSGMSPRRKAGERRAEKTDFEIRKLEPRGRLRRTHSDPAAPSEMARSDQDRTAGRPGPQQAPQQHPAMVESKEDRPTQTTLLQLQIKNVR